MPATPILNDDWSEYDQRKKAYGDVSTISCDQQWEVNYLINKIKKVYAEVDPIDARAAIKHCCIVMPEPRKRKAFLTCVMRWLGY